jgi:hypothetical protein
MTLWALKVHHMKRWKLSPQMTKAELGRIMQGRKALRAPMIIVPRARQHNAEPVPGEP